MSFLKENECRIFFLRHFDHQGNILLPQEIERAQNLGQGLKKRGFIVKAAYSSPTPRALISILEVLKGMFKDEGINFSIHTDSRLIDLGSELRERLIQEAKEKKIPLEEYIFQAEWFRERLEKRAEEGAQVLEEIADKNIGKTVLVCSHGVLMEIFLQALKGGKISRPKNFIEKGQIVELVFEKINYLDGKGGFRKISILKKEKPFLSL